MNLKTELKLVHKIAIAGVFVIAVGIFISQSLPIHAVTFSVNSTADTSDYAPGDGFCDADAGAEMVCTLRAAIEEINAQGGNNFIDFGGLDPTEAEDGQWTIEISSVLPIITTQITITAEHQWDEDGDLIDRPGVHLTPAGGTSLIYGLRFSENANNSRVSGLKISGFDDYGILFGADNSQIGLDCLGTPTESQRNVIVDIGTGDYGDGAIVLAGADDNHVSGNWLGLDEDGATSLPGNPAALYIVNSDNNIFGFEDSDNRNFACTVDQARNIINDGRSIISLSEYNKFSGNYFNVLPDGSDIIEISEEFGLYVWGAENNTVGTDGDGNDDELEGNVISGYRVGVYFWVADFEFGGNRVSGNIIGGDSTGTQTLTNPNQEWGVLISKGSQYNVIGYCDDEEDSKIGVSDICDDGGQSNPEDQANYFMGMSDPEDSGVMINSHASNANNFVYGNNFGFGTDNSAHPISYGIHMRAVRDIEDFNYLGDEGPRANTIKNATEAGIWLAMEFDHEKVARNQSVRYNTITENTGHGILIENTKYRQAIDSVEGMEVIGNTITENGKSGVAMIGGSAQIENNTITGNAEYGIYVEAVLEDLVQWPDTPTNAYNQKQSYLGRADDLVPWPIMIGGEGVENTISDNLLGGIKFLDVIPTDLDQIYTDNTFTDNNSMPAIISGWWGAVELLNDELVPIGSGTHTITISPQSGTAYAGATVDYGEFTGENDTDVAWGPTGFDLDEARTWFEITNTEIAIDGTRTDYGPFSISVTGDHANDSTLAGFTFDGLNNDVDQGGLTASYLTGVETYRYQVAEAIVSTIPDQPTNLYPEHANMAFVTVPTLTASDFLDTSETHAASRWQIYDSELACTQGNTGNVYDSGEVNDLASHQVPEAVNLLKAVNYWWTVTYKNSFGNYTEPSACTYFWIKSGSSTQLLTPPSTETEEQNTSEEEVGLTEEAEETVPEEPAEETLTETEEDESYDADGVGGGTPETENVEEMVETSETEEAVSQDLNFDLYIKNPDGSVRYSGTDFVETTIVAQTTGHRLYRFEDKGNDFDYNDVLIEVQRTSETGLQVHVVAVQANWHHEIYAEIDGQDLLLWDDSHEAVGQTAVLAVVNNDLLGMEYRQDTSSIHAQAYIRE